MVLFVHVEKHAKQVQFTAWCYCRLHRFPVLTNKYYALEFCLGLSVVIALKPSNVVSFLV